MHTEIRTHADVHMLAGNRTAQNAGDLQMLLMKTKDTLIAQRLRRPKDLAEDLGLTKAAYIAWCCRTNFSSVLNADGRATVSSNSHKNHPAAAPCDIRSLGR